MADERELTRAELQAQLKALQTENEQLKSQDVAALVRAEVEKALAAKPEPLSASLQRQLDEANVLLSKRAVATGMPNGPMPAWQPYKGWVQATEDCHYGGFYRSGPKHGEKDGQPVVLSVGELFEVDVPVLWSDDPYIPVGLKISDSGAHYALPHPNPPLRVDFRFRKQSAGSADLTPLRANQF